MNASRTPEKTDMNIPLHTQVYQLELERDEAVQAYHSAKNEIAAYLANIEQLAEEVESLSRANERLRKQLAYCPWLLRLFRLA